MGNALSAGIGVVQSVLSKIRNISQHPSPFEGGVNRQQEVKKRKRNKGRCTKGAFIQCDDIANA